MNRHRCDIFDGDELVVENLECTLRQVPSINPVDDLWQGTLYIPPRTGVQLDRAYRLKLDDGRSVEICITYVRQNILPNEFDFESTGRDTLE